MGAGSELWAGGSQTPGPSFCLRRWTARLLAAGAGPALQASGWAAKAAMALAVAAMALVG